jgi:hypothetical protein
MPRFYFDVRDGDKFIGDDEGIECRDIDVAGDTAAAALGDMAKDVLPGPLIHEMAVEVRDSEGVSLLRAALRFELQRLR